MMSNISLINFIYKIQPKSVDTLEGDKE